MLFGRPLAPRCVPVLAPHGRVLEGPLDSCPPSLDLLVPLRTSDVLFVASHRQRFPNALAPDRETVLKFSSPSGFAAWVRSLGLSEHVPSRHSGKFPCVLKEDRESDCSKGVHVCENQHELDVLRTSLHRKNVPYLVQDAVLGHSEYVAHSLVHRGEIVRQLVLRLDFPTELHKKDRPYPGTPVELPLPVLAELYRRTEYTGFACANFKLPEGREVFFEINPRAGASLFLEENGESLRLFLRDADTFLVEPS